MTTGLPMVVGASVAWTDVVSATGAGVAALAALATSVVAIVAVRYAKGPAHRRPPLYPAPA